MSKIKTKELVICIFTITILILTITTNVFAQDIGSLANSIGNNSSNNASEEIPDLPTNNVNRNNTSINNTNSNNVSTNNTNRNNASTNNSNKNNVTTMPYTGVDYSVIFIIVICGISAIYAYKKIKDYNNL